jgi:hypothetical protein
MPLNHDPIVAADIFAALPHLLKDPMGSITCFAFAADMDFLCSSAHEPKHTSYWNILEYKIRRKLKFWKYERA